MCIVLYGDKNDPRRPKRVKFSSAWFNNIVNHYLHSAIVDLMRLIYNMN